ncbi:CotD family spore coat protein [Bacillus sp. NPDC077027]|uniref:spore coat protein n=1 Tax=Bacillus sp. NPDC077027 TaxID=3390548 RepID=UPI003D01123C
MSRNRLDNFFFGSRRGNNEEVETIVLPTKNIVNTTTNVRTVRRIHPTHITNVNKNIKRIENYYPVTHSVINECYVEEYDCGSDLKNPCCRLIKRCNK